MNYTRSTIKPFALIAAAFLLFASNAATVSAQDVLTLSPKRIDLMLAQGQSTVVQASLTIHPFCFRPVNIDVVASLPGALVVNQTGILLNGCGGDSSVFDLWITGSGEPQAFDLLFTEADFGVKLGSIPVTITPPDVKPILEPLKGLLILQHGILFQVASSGCTAKQDFTVRITAAPVPRLHLLRLREDPCDGLAPLGTAIWFTYRELGLRPGAVVEVANPLAEVVVPLFP